MGNLKLVNRHNRVKELASMGKTQKEIGLELGVTKQRISQMTNGIDPRIVRREKRKKEFNILAEKIKVDLNNGVSVDKIRKKYGLKTSDISSLYRKGIDVRIIKPEIIKKRDDKCLKLFKNGLTGYEIINEIPELKTIGYVYDVICKLNNGSLPKRINTRQRRAIKINEKIAKLKKKHTFTEVHRILVDKGFKNLDGGDLKLETVMNYYYKCRKK